MVFIRVVFHMAKRYSWQNRVTVEVPGQEHIALRRTGGSEEIFLISTTKRMLEPGGSQSVLPSNKGQDKMKGP